MRYLLIASFFLYFSYSFAQPVNIIPQPVSIKQPKIAAKFLLTAATEIVLEGSNMNNSVNFLNDYLQRFYKFKLKVVKTSTNKNVIRLNFERLDNKIAGAYNLTVDSKGVYIAGDNEDGVFYGIQTLIQLLPTQFTNSKLPIPFVSITDAPRFAYRGLHLDVCRHFMPVDFIKKYIDFIALHKMNYFHWHLTDDQGWRIEIKKYPKLTSVGGWRNGTIIGQYPGTGNDSLRYGGFYTQEQIKEVVAYAKKRYITVIPEIEMPGHASAAIAAYPELSCFPNESTQHPEKCAWYGDTSGKQVQQTWGVFEDVFAPTDYTFNFLQDVLDEVIKLFPSPYIHVGGDECPKEAWKRSAFCQQLIKDKGLKDEHGLQSYFIERIEKYINSRGRKIIGWDEILEGGLAPNATVMSWRGEQGGIDAAKQNHDVVMTPGNPVYFDHSQSENEDSVTIGGYNPIEKVYAYEPIPKELNEEQAKHILGAQANLWTEYIKNPSKAEYMIFPRLSALSEILWSPKEKRNWSDFKNRLLIQFKRYNLWKANYSKAFFDLKAIIVPTDNFNGVNLSISNGYEKGLLIFRAFEQFTGKDTQVVYTTSHPSNFPQYEVHDSPWWLKKEQTFSSTGKFLIKNGGEYSVTNYKIRPETGKEMLLDPDYPIQTLKQSFHFNKATGKKITMSIPASESYPGDGAFTLVNGVQNEKGFAKSKEFLGFNGTDCDAMVNLGSFQFISTVTIHALQRTSSWIWRPLSFEAYGSVDGQYFSRLGITTDFTESENGKGNGTMTVSFVRSQVNYVRVIIKNWGPIPAGYPGAGEKPWLFVDEIEVN